MHINHLSLRVSLNYQIASGLHQVSFTKAHSTIKKKRVICLARVLPYLMRRRARQLVGFALNVGLKSERLVKAALESPRSNRMLLGISGLL